MKKVVPLVMCAVLGAFAGWFLKPAPESAAKDATPVKERRAKAKPASDPGLQGANAALRKRVAELEAALAAAERKSEEAVPVPVATNAPAEPPRRFAPPGFASFREELERMKREEPEKYAARTNQMAQWRQGHLNRTARQLDWLASVDTSRMSAKQREAHEKYQDLVVRREELMEKMSPESGATDAEREQAMREMHGIGRQLWELAETERDTLLRETASSLGFSGNDAKEIVDTVKAIYRNTGMGFGGPRGGRPGGPPGGRGGRR